MEGALLKKNKIALWKRRYFVACHSTCSLLIYEGADKITIRDSVALTRETQVERIGATQFSLSGVRQLRKGKCKSFYLLDASDSGTFHRDTWVTALRQLQLVTFFDAQPAAAISDVDAAAQPCVPISAVEPWLTHFTAIKGSTEDQDARRAVAAALAELKNEGYTLHPLQIHGVVVSMSAASPDAPEAVDDGGDCRAPIDRNDEETVVQFSMLPEYVNPQFASAASATFITSLQVRGPIGGRHPFYDVSVRRTTPFPAPSASASGGEEVENPIADLKQILPVSHPEVSCMLHTVGRLHCKSMQRVWARGDRVTVHDNGQYYYVCFGQSSDSGADYIDKATGNSIDRPDDIKPKWGPGCGMNVSYAPEHYREVQRKEQRVRLRLMRADAADLR